jgi:diaminopimelate decarboxylase
VHFANKANANQAVIRVLADCGAGADITSAGELERALRAGVAPGKIVYSGVGKRRDEIAAALAARIHQLNAESLPELRAISEVASSLGVIAPVTLRVNPDVDAKSHRKISTGHKETKFGIAMEQIDAALHLATTLPALAFKGFTVHVGSYLGDYGPYRLTYGKLAELVRATRAKGIAVERLDLGGGIGIAYDGETMPPFSGYAGLVHEIIAPLDCDIAFEPGRRLVGDAGVLVSRVVYAKKAAARNFLILDAGMNDLVRPAMYDARHGIIPLQAKAGLALSWDVVGPVCETGDLFGENYQLPDMQEGDLVAILQGGAYGATMSSMYNGRPLVPEVLVAGAQYAIVRRRIPVAEQISWESMPEWLQNTCAA